MPKKKNTKSREKQSKDLAFEFTGCKFNVVFEPECIPEDKQNEIEEAIDVMSERLYIDKSYVRCNGNKHDDVFLTLEGWKSLQTMLNETEYGDSADNDQYEMILQSYYSMALGYMYTVVNNLYPEYITHMQITISNTSNLEVDILEDTWHEWKTYPGKWQTWKENN